MFQLVKIVLYPNYTIKAYIVSEMKNDICVGCCVAQAPNFQLKLGKKELTFEAILDKEF